MQVKVDFYGEALCPYCGRFLADVAAPLFAQGFAPYMDFRYAIVLVKRASYLSVPPPKSMNNLDGYGRYVAYGNARNTSDGLVCQHGAEECTENRVLLCAIDSSPNWCAAFDTLRSSTGCCASLLALPKPIRTECCAILKTCCESQVPVCVVP